MQKAQIRTAIIWALLLIATGISFFTSHHHELNPNVAYVSICILSYCKCRMVVMGFMEVNHAPVGWKTFFELWMMAVIGEIVIFGFSTL